MGSLLERVTSSAKETESLGCELGERLRGGAVWLLTGELGAGKTVLVRGICRGLGISGPVRSPSFTLMTSYAGGRLPVVHVDLYRLETAEAVAKLGSEDLIPEGAVVLIEWGERSRFLAGGDRFEVEIRHRGGADERSIRIVAWGAAAGALGSGPAALAQVAGPAPC